MRQPAPVMLCNHGRCGRLGQAVQSMTPRILLEWPKRGRTLLSISFLALLGIDLGGRRATSPRGAAAAGGFFPDKFSWEREKRVVERKTRLRRKKDEASARRFAESSVFSRRYVRLRRARLESVASGLEKDLKTKKAEPFQADFWPAETEPASPG